MELSTWKLPDRRTRRLVACVSEADEQASMVEAVKLNGFLWNPSFGGHVEVTAKMD
jgi:hypothetical protein